MPNEWKVILRAGEELDLSTEKKGEYTNLAAEVYADNVSDAPSSKDPQEFDQFLNERVFSDARLVEFVDSTGASQTLVSQFQHGEVDIESLIKTWNQIQFSLDELIDMVMMLKLVRDYARVSYEGRISSRYRLQKLLYLVNLEIQQEQPLDPVRDYEEELGMLDRTGYRYRFYNRASGPFSEQAYEDKNRLFAWCLIDEPIVDSEGTGEVAEQNRRYAVELSAQGEILTEQFYELIENSESWMVSSWNLAQKKVVNETAGMSLSELEAHISEVSDSKREVGDILLSGPDRKFKKNDVKFLGQLAEQMDAMTESRGVSGVTA